MADNGKEVVQQFLSQVGEPAENVDYRSALRKILEGKTREEYFNIVDGLFEAYDGAEGRRDEQDWLLGLRIYVMGIGDDVLGIDWN